MTRRSARVSCLVWLFAAFVLLVTFNFERFLSNLQLSPAKFYREPRRQKGISHHTSRTSEPSSTTTTKVYNYEENHNTEVTDEKEVRSTATAIVRRSQKYSDTNQVKVSPDLKEKMKEPPANTDQKKEPASDGQNTENLQSDELAVNSVNANQAMKSVKSEIEFVHEQRAQHIRTICDSVENKKRRVYGFLFWKRKKLACKTVPKAGSTFMIQMFGLLNGAKDTILTQSRIDLHNGTGLPYKEKISLQDLHSYTVMMTTRNPYTRLFSAYIDKVFLPCYGQLTYDIIEYIGGEKRRENRCKFEASFEEFLIYATQPDSNKAVLRSHYGPLVYDYQLLCQYRDVILVKHETFSQDVQYALEKVRADEETIEKVNHLLFRQNERIAIATVTKGLFAKIHKHTDIFKTSSCFGWEDVVQRLWKSFQIQGHISMKSPFPWTMFPTDQSYSSANHVVNVFLKEIEARPLSSSEKSKQRNHFLAEAYKSVSENTMAKVKEMYSRDFAMYQYDINQF